VEGASGTRSLLINSQDPRGAKFVVTTREATSAAKKSKGEDLKHFSKADVDMYYGASKAEGGRPGIAVLGFQSSKVAEIKASYEAKHPALIASYKEYGSGSDVVKILEVFSYYLPGESLKTADKSTRLRWVQGAGNEILPGFTATEAEYPADAMSAYSDHWVSNVVDRVDFLKTLEDSLGFNSKVDFNAGVVAAGEAIIESTVSGNTPGLAFSSPEEIMLNQSQIYLPTNNALSAVGHVHLFLEELGQGIQHIASRVHDLPDFISRANNYREMTGQGFSFLRIPRSYYGYLTKQSLETEQVPADVATAVLEKLQAAGLMNKAGIVELEITAEQIEALALGKAAKEHMSTIVTVVRRARYNNMYNMIGDSFAEEMYMKIVRNHILVDIQAGDILFQIFTSMVLQRKAGMEAPFLEFIQRVCSTKLGADGKAKPIRPGCGGFGIRNFLTLFLSIEVSKAMADKEKYLEAGDEKKAAVAARQVELFTEQLDLANPILTSISDAMTAEADAMVVAQSATTAAEKDAALAEVKEYQATKKKGNDDLQALSDKYKGLMRELREQQ